MEQLKQIIKGNPDTWFVVWMKNEQDCQTVFDTLSELGYECTIPLKPFKEMWDDMCKESNCQFGVKIKTYSPDCSFNESLEHWKEYTREIIEFKEDGTLGFIDDEEENN